MVTTNFYETDVTFESKKEEKHEEWNTEKYSETIKGNINQKKGEVLEPARGISYLFEILEYDR